MEQCSYCDQPVFYKVGDQLSKHIRIHSEAHHFRSFINWDYEQGTDPIIFTDPVFLGLAMAKGNRADRLFELHFEPFGNTMRCKTCGTFVMKQYDSLKLHLRSKQHKKLKLFSDDINTVLSNSVRASRGGRKHFSSKDDNSDQSFKIVCERCPFVAIETGKCPALFMYNVHLLQYHPKLLSSQKNCRSWYC